MKEKEDTPVEYINNAIEAMNKAIPGETSNKEVNKPIETPEIALIEPYSRKHKTGVKLIDRRMRAILLKLAEKYFFYDAVSAKAGIYRQRLTEEISRNKDFGRSFAYARHKFIALHQERLIAYAQDKREKDWRAEKYILTIADKEYSERKYLTEAVTNQDAKINMLIKTEQLNIAVREGKKLLETVDTQGQEEISLLPFNPKKVEESTKRKKRPAVPQKI